MPAGSVIVGGDDFGVLRTSSIYSQDDPLTAATRPPPFETEVERRVRLEREAEARRVSEEIDAGIYKERERLKKSKADIKLLLLGQAESGKSTLLKQWQLFSDPSSLERERSLWRIVVYANIARAITLILETLEAYDDTYQSAQSVNGAEATHGSRDYTGSNDPIPMSFSPNGVSVPSSPTALSAALSTSPTRASLVTHRLTRSPSQQQIATLRLRLSPLVAAEKTLSDRLSGGMPRPLSAGAAGASKDMLVKVGWQTRAAVMRRPQKKPNAVTEERDELLDAVASMLNASKQDISELWENPLVRKMISRRRLRMEESAEFFLSEINRVSAIDYVPTTDDIFHARIQTMGVEEHTFVIPEPFGLTRKDPTWRLYDVAGAMGQRHAWVPYFEDTTAIIFMAPISAFDQYLDEDFRKNRIDDSLKLWETICSHPLLKRAMLVLFLNKADLLARKLKNGVRVNKYITSYQDRPNEYDEVVNYFRSHFIHVHKKYADRDSERQLYIHLTSVINQKETRGVISDVRDSVFRGHLATAALV